MGKLRKSFQIEIASVLRQRRTWVPKSMGMFNVKADGQNSVKSPNIWLRANQGVCLPAVCGRPRRLLPSLRLLVSVERGLGSFTVNPIGSRAVQTLLREIPLESAPDLRIE